ncbi:MULTISPECIES: hypothetical protein, partial [unclassified Burkholderia]|uniref:hypothetical protein n=1 Tax=unclassified Burkholderia TaxID=2613784 RepID=UPI002AB1D0BC
GRASCRIRHGQSSSIVFVAIGDLPLIQERYRRIDTLRAVGKSVQADQAHQNASSRGSVSKRPATNRIPSFSTREILSRRQRQSF